MSGAVPDCGRSPRLRRWSGASERCGPRSSQFCGGSCRQRSVFRCLPVSRWPATARAHHTRAACRKGSACPRGSDIAFRVRQGQYRLPTIAAEILSGRCDVSGRARHRSGAPRSRSGQRDAESSQVLLKYTTITTRPFANGTLQLNYMLLNIRTIDQR